MTTLSTVQHEQLHQLLIQHRCMLPVASLQQYLNEMDCTIDQFMQALLPLATELALVPISGFRAGAVALGEMGNLYLGANLEFGKTPLGQAVHAEQAAVAIAHQHGETNLVKMAINANPCGHCRQFLFELADGGKLEVLVKGEQPQTLSRLLPHAFGPKELNVEGGMLSPQQHALQFVSGSDALADLALKAAERSYAPYTEAYAGVVLRTRDDRTFTGSYLENVAFNPSLPAMQAAFVNLVLSGCRYDDVVEAVFVQVKDNIVNQEMDARIVLNALCPNVVCRTGELMDKSL